MTCSKHDRGAICPARPTLTGRDVGRDLMQIQLHVSDLYLHLDRVTLVGLLRDAMCDSASYDLTLFDFRRARTARRKRTEPRITAGRHTPGATPSGGPRAAGGPTHAPWVGVHTPEGSAHSESTMPSAARPRPVHRQPRRPRRMSSLPRTMEERRPPGRLGDRPEPHTSAHAAQTNRPGKHNEK